jgi:hypothetical protein
MVVVMARDGGLSGRSPSARSRAVQLDKWMRARPVVSTVCLALAAALLAAVVLAVVGWTDAHSAPSIFQVVVGAIIFGVIAGLGFAAALRRAK